MGNPAHGDDWHSDPDQRRWNPDEEAKIQRSIRQVGRARCPRDGGTITAERSEPLGDEPVTLDVACDRCGRRYEFEE